MSSQKKKKKIKKRSFNNYSPTKVKARNFLTIISYNRVKDEDFNNIVYYRLLQFYSFISKSVLSGSKILE